VPVHNLRIADYHTYFVGNQEWGFSIWAHNTNCTGALAKARTYLYQKVSAIGTHLKFGVTNDPLTRYSARELGGGRLRILAEGTRNKMLELERKLHSTMPLGPEEGQKFYQEIQRLKGLTP
jgi:hypothetical protein